MSGGSTFKPPFRPADPFPGRRAQAESSRKARAGGCRPLSCRCDAVIPCEAGELRRLVTVLVTPSPRRSRQQFGRALVRARWPCDGSDAAGSRRASDHRSRRVVPAFHSKTALPELRVGLCFQPENARRLVELNRQMAALLWSAGDDGVGAFPSPVQPNSRRSDGQHDRTRPKARPVRDRVRSRRVRQRRPGLRPASAPPGCRSARGSG